MSQIGKLYRSWDREVEFHWKVEKFSSLGDEVDSRCNSPRFYFCGRPWILDLYPNGGSWNHSEGYILVEPSIMDIDPPFEVRYCVGVRSVKGDTEVWQTGMNAFYFTKHHFIRCINKSKLLRRKKELLPGDVLTLTFRLKLEEDEASKAGSPVYFVLPPNMESLSMDFSKLFDNQVLPDVKLQCADRTISAHRAVLAARSEVFAAMFRNKMVESETGVIEVTDLDAPVLELLLGYMYTGKIHALSQDLMLSVYAACGKYGVHSLKKECSDRMIEGLTEDNCISFLTVADAHSDAPVKDEVVSFICGREAFLQSKVWLRFCKDHSELANEVAESYCRSRSRTRMCSKPYFSSDRVAEHEVNDS